MAMTPRPFRPRLTEHAEYIVEEVTWLTSQGVHPTRLANQLGYADEKNLRHRLRLWGVPHIADLIPHQERTP